MASASQPPCIYVLAGANGAGKSSLGGAALLQHGVEYFNPDEAARRILAANPTIIQEDATSAAWHEGKRLLERAITERLNFAFETTLGGNTIPALLERALESGIEVRVWYVGLNTPELHVARVRSRVERGGHDIPEVKIRERYHRSRIDSSSGPGQGRQFMRSHDSSRMDETDPVGGAEIFQVRRQQCRARQMPKAKFQREVEKELAGKDSEPSELIYFKVYKSQIPVTEQAIETAALMLGSDKSRGYCLEMICADFLAGASIDGGNPELLLQSISRYYKFLPSPQQEAFRSEVAGQAS